MNEMHVLDNIIFVGGPPRSGTTFAAKSLNSHPAFIAAIDDHVYECWGLYYNRNRTGLVEKLRSGQVSMVEAHQILKDHLFADEKLVGAAPSDKIKCFPLVEKTPCLFSGLPRSVWDNDLELYSIPLAQFSCQWRLCLKSPEISFVLPQLAHFFPRAKFVLVYRPIIETAESMHRIGNAVKRFPVYHKRWMEEKTHEGELIPPPGIPDEWNTLWQGASDFQRCVVYAASYMRGLLQGTGAIDADRYFVYKHNDLQKFPGRIFGQIARFLGVEVGGFQTAEKLLKNNAAWISSQLADQYSEIETELGLKKITHHMDSLCQSIDGFK